MSQVRLDHGSLPANQDSYPNHSQQRPYFHRRENVLDSLPVLEALHIGPSQESYDQQRDQLSSRERERIIRQDMDGPADVVRFSDLRPQHAKVAGESHSGSSNSPRLNYHK